MMNTNRRFNSKFKALLNIKDENEIEPELKADNNLSNGMGLFNNRGCPELFQNLKVNQIRMYDERSARVRLRFKFRKKMSRSTVNFKLFVR